MTAIIILLFGLFVVLIDYIETKKYCKCLFNYI